MRRRAMLRSPALTALRCRLKFFYDIASIVALQTTLNYSVIPFMLMDLKPTFEAWRRLGYYGHWLCACDSTTCLPCVRSPPADRPLSGLVPLLAFSLGAGKPLRTQLKARDAKHQKAVERQVAKEADRGADKGLTIPPETVDQAAEAVKAGVAEVQKEL